MNDDRQQWPQGSGVIQHSERTRQRVETLVETLAQGDPERAQACWRLLRAADTLANAGLWLTVHMTYADQVYLDGRPLQETDFKTVPEGHTGGALNMVIGYVGYLLANALTGHTRAWLMGQGHCVAAIDAVNILTGNLDLEQAARYGLTDAGLSRLCQDFYSYAIGPDGRSAVPLGSHVNVHTAGGISEGGYLGFAGLQYVHMPLPGQELVAFLSDGAFEEQRGSDLASRWWRGEDSGLVMPIMIANGRRIDQRTTMAQVGGVDWFRRHLQLNGFEPVDVDGRDPADFAWAILQMRSSLLAQYQQIQAGAASYPVKLPYAIAETEKGFGFPGAATNAAHNLPLPANPKTDARSRQLFNEGCVVLFQPLSELQAAVSALNNHAWHNRVREKDHYLRQLQVAALERPALPSSWPARQSPMAAIDDWLVALVQANPQHRVRVGNPDEMRSNQLNRSLDLLQHRVTAPEAGVAEGLLGSVITALNEEAVVSAALANKQGINLAVSYEAFAVKMLGAMRQELIFARHSLEAGHPPQWLSVPVLATSHTWENGKNEQSHQDPTLAEAWLGEMADLAPVLFPVDAPTAVASLQRLYGQRGRIATVVVPKRPVPVVATTALAEQAVADGVLPLQHSAEAAIQLLAIGAYQLAAVQRAAQRLSEHGVACSVLALLEPGRFRLPRDPGEADYVHSAATIARLIPAVQRRLIVSHTRPEIITGVLRPLDTGSRHCRILGYANRGGTFDVFGMQYANGQTWAHIVAAAEELLAEAPDCLAAQERAALAGEAAPELLR